MSKYFKVPCKSSESLMLTRKRVPAVQRKLKTVFNKALQAEKQ